MKDGDNVSKWEGLAVIILLGIFVILFAGEPDIHDAIIKRISP